MSARIDEMTRYREAIAKAVDAERERDAARTGCLAMTGELHEHLALMVGYLEQETSQGDGIAEEHHDGYVAAKSLVERTREHEGLWERAQIKVHDLSEMASHIPGLTAELDTAKWELDAARRELAELALSVGYGERPEGQGHILHADGKTLAGAWLLERKGRDTAEAERDEAKTLVSELVAALEICSEWMDDNVPADSWGLRGKRADADRVASWECALKIANAAMAKAKGGGS